MKWYDKAGVVVAVMYLWWVFIDALEGMVVNR